MKRSLLLLFIASAISLSIQAKTWTVTNNGFAFSPASLTIQQGDTVVFTLQSSHDAREVTQATYNANGSTALSGGFQTAFGGGTVLPAKLATGTHYYVCSNHASMGMKGTIVVQAAANVSEIDILPMLDLYPNPSKGKFSISTPVVPQSGSIKVLVYDLLGHLVVNTSLNDKVTSFDLEDQKKGIYLVKITYDNAAITKKVMIE